MWLGPLEIWVYGKCAIYDIQIAVLWIPTTQLMPCQHSPVHQHLLWWWVTSPQSNLPSDLGDNPWLHKLGSAQCIPNYPCTMVQWCMVERSTFAPLKWALVAGGKSSTMGMVCSLIGTKVVDSPETGIGKGNSKVDGAGPHATIWASCR